MRIATGSKMIVCNVGTSEGVRKGDAARKMGATESNVRSQWENSGSSLPVLDESTLSPSGHVSGRSRRAMLKRTSAALFGPGGLAKPQGPQISDEQREKYRQEQEKNMQEAKAKFPSKKKPKGSAFDSILSQQGAGKTIG